MTVPHLREQVLHRDKRDLEGFSFFIGLETFQVLLQSQKFLQIVMHTLKW